MNTLVDESGLKTITGNYRTGNASCLLNPALLQATRMRRRQLGQMMRAYDVELAKQRVAEGEYYISKKIDGEFTCVLYDNGDLITLNPGGTVRIGAAVHNEAAKLLKKAGIKTAMLGAELYVRRSDDQRPRVHDVARVARAAKSEEETDSLCLAVFNLYDLDGEDLSMRYSDAIKKIEALFADANRVHCVETVHGDKKALFERFDEWVLEEGEEGVVIRSDSLGVYKIKQRHSLDLAVVGYSTGVDDRSALLHSLLLAIVRNDGSFQIVARCGGGFTDELRATLIKTLEPLSVESDYAEVNSDRVAYQMIMPKLVVEISCLDVIARTSHGSTIDRMVINWNTDEESWEGVRRLPLCSILSPQFVRIRDDKEPNADDVRISQLSDITDIPDVSRVAEDLKLAPSEILQRAVATKELKGHTMVRKLILWKTNKEKASSEFPAYVLHLTDYSPGRKAPLKHEIRVTDSKAQTKALWAAWEKKYFVRGWKAYPPE
ncbi:MAG: hypothetical protein KTR32_25830 [Granulosicoccus sp.]|nr:hypothetical protein [Granulosicoccus sp.]